MEEWWWGEFVKKNAGLDWWYLDDMWVISSIYHPHIIQISPTYHPDITHISSIYHPHILQISHGQYFLQPPNLVKSQVITQIWHDYCRKKLHFEISSSRYYPNIIQISSRNHQEIIKKSSKNHPDIIQSTSVFTTPQLGEKSSYISDMARLL